MQAMIRPWMGTTSFATAHHEAICAAIARRRRLRVVYDGGERIIEPFCYGIGRDGQGLLRAWQVSGHSRSGQRTGWKLLRVDWMRQLWCTGEGFGALRRGYDPVDPAILCVEARV